MNALYLLVGGFLFNAAERPAHIVLQSEAAVRKGKFWNLISHLDNLEEDLQGNVSSSKPILDLNIELQKLIKGEISDKMKEEKDIECEAWTKDNSMFFAFTSITTIGYGRLVPHTQLGRGFCILYLIIGIPITSFIIGFMGTVILTKGSHIFFFFFSFFCFWKNVQVITDLQHIDLIVDI